MAQNAFWEALQGFGSTQKANRDQKKALSFQTQLWLHERSKQCPFLIWISTLPTRLFQYHNTGEPQTLISVLAWLLHSTPANPAAAPSVQEILKHQDNLPLLTSRFEKLGHILHSLLYHLLIQLRQGNTLVEGQLLMAFAIQIPPYFAL